LLTTELKEQQNKKSEHCTLLFFLPQEYPPLESNLVVVDVAIVLPKGYPGVYPSPFFGLFRSIPQGPISLHPPPGSSPILHRNDYHIGTRGWYFADGEYDYSSAVKNSRLFERMGSNLVMSVWNMDG
jgi:hypothetical protein